MFRRAIHTVAQSLENTLRSTGPVSSLHYPNYLVPVANVTDPFRSASSDPCLISQQWGDQWRRGYNGTATATVAMRDVIEERYCHNPAAVATPDAAISSDASYSPLFASPGATPSSANTNPVPSATTAWTGVAPLTPTWTSDQPERWVHPSRPTGHDESVDAGVDGADPNLHAPLSPAIDLPDTEMKIEFNPHIPVTHTPTWSPSPYPLYLPAPETPVRSVRRAAKRKTEKPYSKATSPPQKRRKTSYESCSPDQARYISYDEPSSSNAAPGSSRMAADAADTSPLRVAGHPPAFPIYKNGKVAGWPCPYKDCVKHRPSLMSERKADLVRHLETRQHRIDAGEEDSTEYRCEKCDKTFTRGDALKRHERERTCQKKARIGKRAP